MRSGMRMIDADALKKQWSMADKCEDCPQDARHCQFEQDFTRMDICEMIDEAPTVGGWISVKDRLPEDGETVLVYIERAAWGDDGYAKLKNEIAIGWQIDKRWHVDGCTKVKGLHWMPLPEPPEEVSDDAD